MQFLITPIINVLVALYQLLLFLHIPYALGFSIILLTVLIRFILYPFVTSQLKYQKKMQSLSSHITRLKEKHKGDAKRLQQETMKLYKEHGINPLGGCLPTLIQLPIIWGLYGALSEIVKLNITQINKIIFIDFLKLKTAWDVHFFGIPLGQDPSHLITTIGPLIFLVPVLTGALQFIQSKMLFAKPKVVEDIEKKEKKEEDFASAFQTQSMYIFPVMIAFFSFKFPIGLSLYWNTFTVFGILQQYRIQGWGGLEEWIKKF
ncbi:MAG: YidC/Oxa1 family membrane protein insertase, partial [Actinobacteria bacterium]|nr:YidC/Oxa1 family membrane protein insertase [Actinomycetota bacterium]